MLFGNFRFCSVSPLARTIVKLGIGGRTATIGNKDPVVEHKGIVERVGFFSLATSVRSVLSAVGQTALRVRLMFDTGITAKKFVQKGLSEPLSVEGLFYETSKHIPQRQSRDPPHQRRTASG